MASIPLVNIHWRIRGVVIKIRNGDFGVEGEIDETGEVGFGSRH